MNEQEWKNEICKAIESWDSERVRSLLNQDNINNVVDNKGRTPFLVLIDEINDRRKHDLYHRNKRFRNLRKSDKGTPQDLDYISDMMIEFGADPEIKDKRGRNPILLFEPDTGWGYRDIDRLISKSLRQKRTNTTNKATSIQAQENIAKNTDKTSKRLIAQNIILLVIGVLTVFMMWFVSPRFCDDLAWVNTTLGWSNQNEC